jgi:hypothetical protein
VSSVSHSLISLSSILQGTEMVKWTVKPLLCSKKGSKCICIGETLSDLVLSKQINFFLCSQIVKRPLLCSLNAALNSI